MLLFNKKFKKEQILKKIGNLSQIGGTRHYELIQGKAKGLYAIDVNTGSGFNFTLVPDRGLDISRASYKGINLIYNTPNGEVNPMFYQPAGEEWLRTFFGGLLTTCGLTYLGAPGKDGDTELGLHGRFSAIPADRVADNSGWVNDEYIIEISGKMEECALFLDKLRLTRKISTKIGQKSLLIHDSVENFGYEISPYTILYHINPGFPLLDENTYLSVSSKEVTPYDLKSKENFASFDKFSGPIPHFQEENFFHKICSDKDGYGYAAVINENINTGLGLFIRFKTDSLPYLSQWKMMGEGDYVVAIEPCNTKCLNRAELRENNMLPLIAPGEIKENMVEIGVLDGKEEIEAFNKKMDNIEK
jgi:hypothetical protein